ncbi:MAG: hypothetical protein Ct9H300mP25_10640 [Acidobacteriota bacterium]|nr:MAG: hypothetical protein Ct9H300mP25_10640 [Acidobacteriota bacterium]
MHTPVPIGLRVLKQRSGFRKLQQTGSVGLAEGFQVADGPVYRGGQSMTFAQAGERAIEMGGSMTVASYRKTLMR